eukprot:8061405-Alexandrium_andersonii.AAC.1
MESFRGGEGAVHQDDAALQPVSHSRKAESVDELAGARQGLHPVVKGSSRGPALSALRGGHVGLPGVAILLAELLGDHVSLNGGAQALTQVGRRSEEAPPLGVLRMALEGYSDSGSAARAIGAALHDRNSGEQGMADHRSGRAKGAPGGAKLAVDFHRHLLSFRNVLGLALVGARLLQSRNHVRHLAGSAGLGGRGNEGDLKRREGQ